MTTQEFELHIQSTIDKNLYVEPTQFDDRKRVMLTYTGKGPIYICGIPADEVRAAPDAGYQSKDGFRYPCQIEIEGSIKTFLTNLPNDLDLYE